MIQHDFDLGILSGGSAGLTIASGAAQGKGSGIKEIEGPRIKAEGERKTITLSPMTFLNPRLYSSNFTQRP